MTNAGPTALQLLAATTAPTQHPLVRNLPLAKFYYQGNHTHPIRRTILITRQDKKKGLITGYELRCGHAVRARGEAPIRTFKIEDIARFGDYSRLRDAKKNVGRDIGESTFQRASLRKLEEIGV